MTGSRRTARIEGDFVVFLIGMRINRLRSVGKWLPAARAMGRMLPELAATPDLGLLGSRAYRSGRIIEFVQYWRSFEHLHAYARAADAEHLPAWRAFNRAARGNDAVGIWHETFLVRAGAYETVYRDMPPFGLAKAASMAEAVGPLARATGCLGRAVAEGGGPAVEHRGMAEDVPGPVS